MYVKKAREELSDDDKVFLDILVDGHAGKEGENTTSRSLPRWCSRGEEEKEKHQIEFFLFCINRCVIERGEKSICCNLMSIWCGGSLPSFHLFFSSLLALVDKDHLGLIDGKDHCKGRFDLYK